MTTRHNDSAALSHLRRCYAYAREYACFSGLFFHSKAHFNACAVDAGLGLGGVARAHAITTEAFRIAAPTMPQGEWAAEWAVIPPLTRQATSSEAAAQDRNHERR